MHCFCSDATFYCNLLLQEAFAKAYQWQQQQQKPGQQGEAGTDKGTENVADEAAAKPGSSSQQHDATAAPCCERQRGTSCGEP
jgi:hypothetical protein